MGRHKRRPFSFSPAIPPSHPSPLPRYIPPLTLGRRPPPRESRAAHQDPLPTETPQRQAPPQEPDQHLPPTTREEHAASLPSDKTRPSIRPAIPPQCPLYIL